MQRVRRRVLHQPDQRRRGRGCQQPGKPTFGQLARRGRDQNQPGHFHRTLGGGPAQIGQRRHPTHRVPHQSHRPGHVKHSQHPGKIIGELLDPVGTHRRRRRPAMTPVVITDHPHRSPIPTQHIADLTVPRCLIQTKPMQENHGVFSHPRAGVTHRQAHPVTGAHQQLPGTRPPTPVAKTNTAKSHSRCGVVLEVARKRGWRGHDAPRCRAGTRRRARRGQPLDLESVCPLIIRRFPSLANARSGNPNAR